MRDEMFYIRILSLSLIECNNSSLLTSNEWSFVWSTDRSFQLATKSSNVSQLAGGEDEDEGDNFVRN